MKSLIGLAFLFACTPLFAANWFARPDGGTRYSVNQPAGQCDGTADVSYASTGGTGKNQHCAFGDVRYFWADGSYTNNPSAGSPAWGWIGSGGDHYIIEGSIADGVSYRVGYNGPSDYYLALAGNPYGSGAPAPPSGTAGAHTEILGGNYASCHAATAKTQLHGGYGVNSVLQMSGVSFVDVACLDITDFSSCGVAGNTNTCSPAIPFTPGNDYAKNGIAWYSTSTNDTLTDVHIHGMASAGMVGPTGDRVVMSYLDLIGNAGAGWSADPGDGTTGTGSLLVQIFNISWNGCAEEYPLVDALPYQDCTDDNSGGYGDGFGTTTVPSKPGWNVTFDQGVASYNTQDGLDALHLTGTGASMTITRVAAFGNLGQQIKVGGASGTVQNNVIETNCNALRQPIPGTPSGYNARLSDFCRAADAGIAIAVSNGSTLKFDNNTIYSASATGVEVDCDGSNGPCDKTALIDYRNNVFLGFFNSTAIGYPVANATNDFSNPIYVGFAPNPFTNPGSLFAHNLTFHAKSNWTCPASGETAAWCSSDPKLTDETWHTYGVGNMQPLAASPVAAAGVPVAGITLDFMGAPRPTIPSLGAYEPPATVVTPPPPPPPPSNPPPPPPPAIPAGCTPVTITLGSTKYTFCALSPK